MTCRTAARRSKIPRRTFFFGSRLHLRANIPQRDDNLLNSGRSSVTIVDFSIPSNLWVSIQRNGTSPPGRLRQLVP